MLSIAVPAETHSGESRVAVTPETAKKFLQRGVRLRIESGAGVRAGYPDREYAAAGAELVGGAQAWDGDLLLKVRAPQEPELALLRRGQSLIAMCNPHRNALLPRYAEAGLSAFALELVPRISRAQNMDVLSSQANVAGYRAVLRAAQLYPRFMPMLMTAAGTVKAARVLVLGAGVAGLQAIATARRLGAVVEAFDVRTAAKEQVESLGAKFVEVSGESGEAAGGYAKEMSDDYKRRQGELVHERALQADIIITTALIPGRDAPRLLHAATVAAMKPGAVIVDMATESGGNVEGSVCDQVITTGNGVHIIGDSNLAAQVACDASALYARNLLQFASLMLDKNGQFTIADDDEIVRATLLMRDGVLLFGSKTP